MQGVRYRREGDLSHYYQRKRTIRFFSLQSLCSLECPETTHSMWCRKLLSSPCMNLRVIGQAGVLPPPGFARNFLMINDLISRPTSAFNEKSMPTFSFPILFFSIPKLMELTHNQFLATLQSFRRNKTRRENCFYEGRVIPENDASSIEMKIAFFPHHGENVIYNLFRDSVSKMFNST
ncbi:hypothetical protein TNCV_2879511 [Trichonephila clavipes]|uniref:Uncharacterized protein n=1 Tax=Trichonephila clavipes TaxID=2585209 RepID=A0A8X6W1X9_TRICX|nr:hypothetical protein TNCV_2879511 [Trichonephila clavipes]